MDQNLPKTISNVGATIGFRRLRMIIVHPRIAFSRAPNSLVFLSSEECTQRLVHDQDLFEVAPQDFVYLEFTSVLATEPLMFFAEAQSFNHRVHTPLAYLFIGPLPYWLRSGGNLRHNIALRP